MSKLKYLTAAILLMTISACGEIKFHEKKEVAAIFWHEANRYSVTIQSGNTFKMYNLPVTAPVRWDWEVNIIADVPEDKSLWYECGGFISEWSGAKDAWCDIHLRTLDDLQTGDWNHGKFGSGKTRRID